MSELLLSFIFLFLGAVLGVGSSAAFWWIQSRYFVPVFDFSEEIAHYQDGEDPGICRVKFRNCGKRKVIDLKVIVRVSAYRMGRRNIWTNFNLRHNTESIPILGQGKEKIINIAYFDGHQIEVSDRITKYTREKINSIDSLKGLFEVGEKVNLVVYVFGYDGFSGTRIVQRSKHYTLSDVRKGVFKGFNVVAP